MSSFWRVVMSCDGLGIDRCSIVWSVANVNREVSSDICLNVSTNSSSGHRKLSGRMLEASAQRVAL